MLYYLAQKTCCCHFIGDQCQHFVNMFVANHAETTKFSNLDRAVRALTRELMRRISKFEKKTQTSYFLWHRRRQMVTFWAKYDTGRSHWMRLVSFVSAVENLCLQKKLHSIKQRSDIHPTILSEAEFSYPTAWEMDERG